MKVQKIMAEGKIVNAGALIEEDDGWFYFFNWNFENEEEIDEWLEMSHM